MHPQPKQTAAGGKVVYYQVPDEHPGVFWEYVTYLAMDTLGWTGAHGEILAQHCGIDYNTRSGSDPAWPLVFTLHSKKDGPALGRFLISEDEPEFQCSAAEQANEAPAGDGGKG